MTAECWHVLLDWYHQNEPKNGMTRLAHYKLVYESKVLWNAVLMQ